VVGSDVVPPGVGTDDAPKVGLSVGGNVITGSTGFADEVSSMTSTKKRIPHSQS